MSRYLPLLVIFGVIFIASWALQLGSDGDLEIWMRNFMGLFFTIFSMFKLIDLGGFRKGFIKYDIPSQKWPWYAALYPFLELGLGLLYLSGTWPIITSLLTLGLMGVSAAGIIREMRRGNKFTCACLGTVLEVPLSTVSLIETVGMGVMAICMIVA